MMMLIQISANSDGCGSSDEAPMMFIYESSEKHLCAELEIRNLEVQA